MASRHRKGQKKARTTAIEPRGATAATSNATVGTVAVTLAPNETAEGVFAALMVEGTAVSALALQVANAPSVAQAAAMSTADVMRELHQRAEAVADGELAGPARMLGTQMSILNSVFTGYLLKAMRAERPDVAEACMKTAFRAQNACRATAEAITVMTHPPHPAVFAKQANITSGPQQINNNTAPAAAVEVSSARATENTFTPNKLLEAGTREERVDVTTTTTTAESHSPMASVGPVNGTAITGRQSDRGPERKQRRSTTKAARRVATTPRIHRRIV